MKADQKNISPIIGAGEDQYVAPDVRTRTLERVTVLCQSNGNTDNINGGENFEG